MPNGIITRTWFGPESAMALLNRRLVHAIKCSPVLESACTKSVRIHLSNYLANFADLLFDKGACAPLFSSF
jgi:hypothetical protein